MTSVPDDVLKAGQVWTQPPQPLPDGVWQYYALNVAEDKYQIVVNVDEDPASNCAPFCRMLTLSIHSRGCLVPDICQAAAACSSRDIGPLSLQPWHLPRDQRVVPELRGPGCRHGHIKAACCNLAVSKVMAAAWPLVSGCRCWASCSSLCCLRAQRVALCVRHQQPPSACSCV